MSLLKTTLVVNALSSGVTGLLLAAGAIPVSDWLGIPVWVSLVVGLGLLAFAVEVALIARRPQPNQVRGVIIVDTAWVVGAVVVMFWFPDSMSSEGLWSLGLVTAAVATFAVLQTLGTRRVEAVV